jgi:hypothetical protein
LEIKKGKRFSFVAICQFQNDEGGILDWMELFNQEIIWKRMTLTIFLVDVHM